MPTPCYPFLGHLPSMGVRPDKKIAEWHAKYGSIIKIRMGAQTWFSISDPNIAHELFVTDHGSDTTNRPYNAYGTKYYSYGKKGIVFADGTTQWKKSRAATLKVLAPKAVERYMYLIEQGSSDLADRLIQATKENGSVNPVENFAFYALSIIASVTLGKKFTSIDDPEFKKTAAIIERSVQLLGPEYDIPNYLPIFGPLYHLLGIEKSMRDFVKNERDVEFSKYITESREKNLDNIITALVNDSEYFDDEEILVVISDMLVAGSETISTTLNWTMGFLCNYPDVQKRMQGEVDSFIQTHGTVPTFSDRSELPYCSSVMREVLRFKPPIPFSIPHQTTKEIALRGYTFPKGSIFITSLDYMHKESGHFDDQEKFNPERYLSDPKTMTAASNGKLSERDQFTFGWGRRICPGIHLAEVEIFNAYVNILAKSNIEPIYESGQPILPNIIDARPGGGTFLPLPYKIRFVERT
ncbi:cytochrome P450 [Backusella circina FSU 941]|nr:cytochrome P450 [Backusella circina FSU 941]